jgi:hypothetical protein
MFEKLKEIIKNILEIVGIYILWIILHFVCSNLYPQFCAEVSLIGFIKSIFVVETPHCIAMRWIIYNCGNIIHDMWTSIGIWISGKLLINATNVFK